MFLLEKGDSPQFSNNSLGTSPEKILSPLGSKKLDILEKLQILKNVKLASSF